MKISKINLLGVNIDPVSREDAVSYLDDLMSKKSKQMICTVNTEFVDIAQHDLEFKKILNGSGLNLADGVGILWGAKFNSLSHSNTIIGSKIYIFFKWLITLILIPLYPAYFRKPIPERIPGSEFVWDIARYARDNNYKLFLLGGLPTVAERTALQLQTKIYGLKVAGVHSGGIKETKEIIDTINKSKANILLVAFGAPKQEKWLHANLNKTCCQLGIGVGGTFDFIAGVKKRAPVFIQKIGLEWAYRLILEPKRIKRQISLPKFVLMILANKFR